MGGVRYYKATQENYYKPEQFLSYGKHVRIEAGVAIAAPERLRVGDWVGIGQRVYINAVGGCHIGTGCEIANDTNILTTEHSYMGGETLPFDMVRLIKPVIIEGLVGIGGRALIAPGVRIGEGAIVAMGSVVVGDVPPLAIVVGNPAKVLMYRPKESFDALKKAGKIVDPYMELPLLKVPPMTKRKYKDEIQEFGFDISGGQEYFYYDKYREQDKRLVALNREDIRTVRAGMGASAADNKF